MAVAMVLLGVALLYWGGEILVKGAVNLSRIYGLSPLVIGLTVVAFGTSTPELASSLFAARRGSGVIAVGNVIGSNIANIGLILGAAALVYPIKARAHFLSRELPILIGTALLMPLVMWGDEITRLEGVVLCVLLVPYVWLLVGHTDEEEDEISQEFDREYGETPDSPLLPAARIGLGIALLVAGAGALVDGAVDLARAVGVSEKVIGITLVAFGTSLPELATSLVAAFRHEGDIAFGNVIGSNVFNILLVLGATAAAVPFPIASTDMAWDTLVMIGFSLALVPCVLTGYKLGRAEGGLLVASYLAYVAYLFAFSAGA